MNKGLLTSFVLLVITIAYFTFTYPGAAEIKTKKAEVEKAEAEAEAEAHAQAEAQAQAQIKAIEDARIKHLLIITIDTVRADTFYAPEDNQYVDRLSPWLKRARLYRHAQSVSPWTIPAIATVLSGYSPNQHGAGAFPHPIANLDVELPSSILPEVPTITERLLELDFNTLAISAHPWLGANFGLQRGFNKIHARKYREDIDVLFAKSINKRKSAKIMQRDFTYLHYMEAHGRHTRRLDEFFPQLSDEQINRSLEWTDLAACNTGAETKICRRYLVYTQAVLDLRDSLANTLEQLESSGLLEDTLVLVYSDHGEEFNDHLTQIISDDLDPRGTRAFGHGYSLYEEQLHIPLLVWNPKDSQGRVVNTPVSLLDVAPSILDWLGVDTSVDNFSGMLLDNAEKEEGRALVASNIAYGPEMISVREGKLKSIWNTVSDESRYFNLQIDPDEQKPLAGNDLVIHFDTLTGDYLWLASANIGTTPELSTDQLQHLKSIGYLQGSQAVPERAPSTETLK